MFVYCSKCGYDSGDHESGDELEKKVNSDGGRMTRAVDENGRPAGWEITCPKGHSDETHID